MKNNKAFTLIEILLVLVVMMSITLIKIKDINEDIMKSQANFLANNIKTVASATNAFIIMKYNDISSLKTINGMTCETTNQTCSLTISHLKSYDLLPPNFSENTVLGKPYSIQLKRTGVAPNYMVSGLILSNGIPSNNTKSNPVLLGNAIKEIGVDGGINKQNGKMIGSHGLWSTDSTLFPILNGKTDNIGAIVGNLSGAYYVYLRRDGTLPMTGDLILDGNNINKIKNLNGTGNISFDGNISSEKNLIAKNGYGDSITIGGDSSGEDYEIKLSNPNRKLTIWTGSKGGAPNSTNKNDLMLQVAGAINSGSITAGGNISAEYFKPTLTSVIGSACAENGLISKDNKGSILSCVSGKWANPASDGVPVGIPLPWPSSVIPSGWLIANGQAFNTTTYPKLAAVYPSGRLPDLRGLFIRGTDLGRGYDAGRTNLSEQGDAIRNIKGHFSFQTQLEWNAGAGGVFEYENLTSGSPDLKGGRRGQKITFDASKVVPTADENRPKNISFTYIIKAE